MTNAPNPAESTDTVITLGESLDISTVTDLKTELTHALDLAGPITLDPTQVERADTASLQLLVSFLLEARRAGVPVNVLPGTDAFGEAVTLLGLGEILAGPAATP